MEVSAEMTPALAGRHNLGAVVRVGLANHLYAESDSSNRVGADVTTGVHRQAPPSGAEQVTAWPKCSRINHLVNMYLLPSLRRSITSLCGRKKPHRQRRGFH